MFLEHLYKLDNEEIKKVENIKDSSKTFNIFDDFKLCDTNYQDKKENDVVK